jgi:hypothetical protein
MKALSRLLARRRLAKLIRPDPAYRERRLAQLTPERRARYLRNVRAIG